MIKRNVYDNYDDAYKDIVEHIEKNGVWIKENVRTKYADGTPAYYKSVFGLEIIFKPKLINGKPQALLCTTKKVATKLPWVELYWIWILMSNKVQELRDLGCTIWDEWELPDGTIGETYGAALRKPYFKNVNQVEYVIDQIKNNPSSRRIITEIWDIQNLNKMALTPCVHMTHWNVQDNKLNLKVTVRSSDVALGNPYNVFQYQILHNLIAKECNLETGDLIFHFGDVHIYDRHYEQLLEQVKKEKKNPGVISIENFKSFFETKIEDVKVENYESNEKINYEVAI